MHARLLSVPETSRCLDAVQLQRLDLSFRAWAQAARGPALGISRSRVLLIFLLIRYTGRGSTRCWALT
jgi:molybdate transport system regulatory protein